MMVFVWQELRLEKEQHAKVNAELEEINKKHNTLKDFVTNSLKPKITTQKENLDSKQAEIIKLRNSKTQLGTV